MAYPKVCEIAYQDPLRIFAHFAGQSGTIFLDSAEQREFCGRYSFIALDPFLTLTSCGSMVRLGDDILQTDPFTILAEQLAAYTFDAHPDLPPFQGGVAGYFSYDLCHYLENIPRAPDDMQFPELVLGLYDLVLAFDTKLQQAWIFSSGFPFQEGTARATRAEQRIQWLLEQLSIIKDLPSIIHQSCELETIQSNFSAQTYQAAVQQVIEYILAGDIFEANISQRFKANLPPAFSRFDLYRRLRVINPAPFSAYLQFDDVTLVSASPERFLKLTDNNVETRPIKGTRPRNTEPARDKQLAAELLASEKDRSENVMIVDLLRNDLSRVCCDHSVQVMQLCSLESYATVHHLVSVVTGKLQTQFSALDLFKAAFPGGSITGAPKIRAMEIIAEIEACTRGPYCGAIGYIGFQGDMDFSITIRTLAIKNNIVTFQAGGAIVADSDPAVEYAETLTKARALRHALGESYDFIN